MRLRTREARQELYGQPTVRRYRGKVRAGAAPTPRGDQGGAGGAVAFIPLAARINPEGYLVSTQLGSVDTSFGILSFDFKGVCGWSFNTHEYTSPYGTENRELCSNIWTAYTSEGVPGVNIAVDNGGNNPGTLRVNFADNLGNAIEATVTGMFANKNAAFGNLTIVWSLATSGARFVNVLWNGVQQTVGYQEYAGAVVGALPGAPSPISVTFVPYIQANPRGFGIGGSGAGDPGVNLTSFDVTRFMLDCSVDFLQANAGVFPPATMAKIWAAGVPVQHNAGATVLGHTAMLYHEGDASTFATERGTTAATWTLKSMRVALGDTPILASASIPPNGVQDGRPAPRWYVNGQFGAAASGAADNFGCDIAINDFLVVIVVTVNASNVDNGLTINDGFAVPTHSGLTLPAVNASAGGRPNNLAVWTKKAAVGDVTANGAAWAGPTISTTVTPARFHYTVINMGQITGLDDMNVAACTPSGSLVPLSLPSVTASVAKTKLLSGVGYYESKDPGKTTIPAGQNLLQKLDNDVGSLAFAQLSEEAITGAGATGARTCTAANFISGGMGAVIGFSMLFKP